MHTNLHFNHVSIFFRRKNYVLGIHYESRGIWHDWYETKTDISISRDTGSNKQHEKGARPKGHNSEWIGET